MTAIFYRWGDDTLSPWMPLPEGSEPKAWGYAELLEKQFQDSDDGYSEYLEFHFPDGNRTYAYAHFRSFFVEEGAGVLEDFAYGSFDEVIAAYGSGSVRRFPLSPGRDWIRLC